MTDLSLFRVYEPDECGPDGYPRLWHTGLVPVQVPAGDPEGEWLDAFQTTIRFRVAHPDEDRGVPTSGLLGVKHVVRMQAGYRCVRCRHPHRPGPPMPCDEQCRHKGPGDKRVLTVHHLTGCWGRTQEAKRDLRWWNLVALCQRCHLTIQGKVDMHRVWPWEHTDWFKPYVAGWYAHAYLGKNITKAQALDRLDELLALERVA